LNLISILQIIKLILIKDVFMHLRTKWKDSGNISVLFLAAVSVIGITFSSCVSYDAVEEGSMNTACHVNGATLIMDRGVDKFIVLGVRNDSSGDVEVRLRPIGGEIGYDFYGGGGYSTLGGSLDNTIRGAYITSGNEAVLSPGEETLITVFLKNWYLANKDFRHRMEIVVDNGLERHALNIYITQDDIFDDAKKTFTDNKLGKNDPSSFGAVHLGIGGLPGNFVLTIPLN
jgi:hypothetical protein